jgi:hypothetical protein
MKPFAGLAQRLLGRLLAPCLLAWGRFRLVVGDPAGAVSALEGAAERVPGSFDAWLHLARALLRARDPARARRALARAREVSPARFAREAGAWVEAEGFDLALLTDGGGRPEPASRHPAMKTAGGAARSLPFGDCHDLDEYARFRAMPPIAPGEWDDVDWDEVADDLQDG